MSDQETTTWATAGRHCAENGPCTSYQAHGYCDHGVRHMPWLPSQWCPLFPRSVEDIRALAEVTTCP